MNNSSHHGFSTELPVGATIEYPHTNADRDIEDMLSLREALTSGEPNIAGLARYEPSKELVDYGSDILPKITFPRDLRDVEAERKSEAAFKRL